MVENANWTLTVRASDGLRHFDGESIGVWLNRNPVGSVEELVFQESVLPGGSVANSDTVSKIGLMYCQGQLR
jgi:hypothetical protein